MGPDIDNKRLICLTGVLERMFQRESDGGECMGRYCIVCRTLFGCVKEREKYICSECVNRGSCAFRHSYLMSQVTGGICDECWQDLYLSKKSKAA